MLSTAVLRWITGCVDLKPWVLFLTEFLLDLMSGSWETFRFGHEEGLGLGGLFLCGGTAAFPLVNRARPSPRLRKGLFTFTLSAGTFYVSEYEEKLEEDEQ